jgi:DNA helicase-2/ATP-dependent DNA helicase PcrA
LEFDHVFLPGWEEGLFPHQRALDESGKAGLEEERRLAYVGITRARKNAHITFASNRQIHGLWQNSLPSRFLDELPEDNVDVVETGSVAGSYGGYGASKSRFDNLDPFTASYTTPGWQRAQNAQNKQKPAYTPRKAITIEGEVLSKSSASRYKVGERIFHLKFGYGHIAVIEGNKLTIDFDKAGRKKVLEDFVEKH